MFRIYDNDREYFWQWDLGQRLIVNDSVCCEVHFCNGTDDCALVCEVYEENDLRLVNVPNILLQTAKVINVFAYVEDGDGGYTKKSGVFSVKARTKPADYVYTETEVRNYENLRKTIEVFVNNAITESVADWDETDETSMSFIKNKPDGDDALELVVEMGLVEPITSDDGAVYTDTDGNVYI